MSKRRRNRTRYATGNVIAPRQSNASAPEASSGWNFRSGSHHTYDGAKFRGSLRSNYKSGFDLDFDALRDRARIACWDSTQARSIITRLGDNTIGTGLSLESSPAWFIIDPLDTFDNKARYKKTREIELRFHLWAQSHEADATGTKNFYELEDFAFRNYIRDGKISPLLRYNGNAARQSPLSIQFLPPEQIGGIGETAIRGAIEAAGRRLIDGIELSATGEELALHVENELTRKLTRIPASGPSGRRFFLHPAITDLAGQVRGVSILAPLIHELQKLTDYTVFELEAALINAGIAAYVVPSADANSSKPFSGIALKGTAATPATASSTAEIQLDRPGLFVQNLKAGEDIKSFDTSRPNVNFGQFVDTVMKSLAASVSTPVEVLEMKFSSNYSASRASLILFWQRIESYREVFGSQFLNPIFEAWFNEETKKRPDLAPGYTAATDPVIRRAWLACSWVGQSMPQIDPLKEAAADSARIEQGATTRERVAMKYNGSDYRENASRLKTENAELVEAGFILQNTPLALAPQKNTDAEKEDENGDGVEK